jgi:hypothetical protein
MCNNVCLAVLSLKVESPTTAVHYYLYSLLRKNYPIHYYISSLLCQHTGANMSFYLIGNKVSKLSVLCLQITEATEVRQEVVAADRI